MPLVFFLSRIGRSESLVLCSAAASLYFIAKDRLRVELRMLLSGCFAALSFCCYLSGAYVIPLAGVIALFSLWKHKDQRIIGCVSYGAGAILTLLIYFSSLGLWTAIFENLNSVVARSEGVDMTAGTIFNVLMVGCYAIKVIMLNEYGLVVMLFLPIVIKGVKSKNIQIVNLVIFAFPCIVVMTFLCIVRRVSYIYLVHLYPWLLFFLLALICIYFKRKVKAVALTIVLIFIYLNCFLFVSVVVKNSDPTFSEKMLFLMESIPVNKKTLGSMDYYYYFAGKLPYRALADVLIINANILEYINDNKIDYFLHDKKFEINVGDELLPLIASSKRVTSFYTHAAPPNLRGICAIKSIIPLAMELHSTGGYELTLYKIDLDAKVFQEK
jgi:hypothetical protein